MKIRVEVICDENYCDTCGSNWARGAIVKFEDGRELNLKPVASCLNPTNYEIEDVYQAILEELGHEVIEV